MSAVVMWDDDDEERQKEEGFLNENTERTGRSPPGNTQTVPHTLRCTSSCFECVCTCVCYYERLVCLQLVLPSSIMSCYTTAADGAGSTRTQLHVYIICLFIVAYEQHPSYKEANMPVPFVSVTYAHTPEFTVYNQHQTLSVETNWFKAFCWLLVSQYGMSDFWYNRCK